MAASSSWREAAAPVAPRGRALRIGIRDFFVCHYVTYTRADSISSKPVTHPQDLGSTHSAAPGTIFVYSARLPENVDIGAVETARSLPAGSGLR